MRIPTRAAPRPPANGLTSSRNGTWSNNQFINGSFPAHPPQKKKPPPRPPPPKFTHNQHQYDSRNDRSRKPTRPTELITNIFGRKTAKQLPSASYMMNRPSSSSSQSSSTQSGTVSLIDLSPPGSPTFTTRSSSDGVSVDSFGSDGNSNPSLFTNSSGNTSQTESGFEDDFDFFGGLSSQKMPRNDPWKLSSNTPDPFSPFPATNNGSKPLAKTVGNADFFAFNDDIPITNQSQIPFSINNSSSNPPTSFMPTIIRAKPAKPPAPRIAQTNLAPTITQFSNKPIPTQRTTVPYNEPVSLDVNDAWNDTFDDEPSPPMPSIPPPAPPPQYLTEEPCQEPYGIALYDFPASQPDDLPLKKGDVVMLVKAVNTDWAEGRVGNRQGIFPVNFVDVKVPLPGLSTNVVNALYAFKGETFEDLTFPESAKITVLSKLSDDWLYGEFNGRRGQFPTNYVDRVPTNLP